MGGKAGSSSRTGGGSASGLSIDAAEHALAADTRALVIGPYLARHAASRAAAGDENQRSHAARLDEAFGLAGAIDLQIVEATEQIVRPIVRATTRKRRSARTARDRRLRTHSEQACEHREWRRGIRRIHPRESAERAR